MTIQGMTERLQAQVLTAALPYIQNYRGKTVVVKYGGNAMINEELKHDVMSDIILLTMVGIKIVLVHGGGPEISEMLDRLGIESQIVGGLRKTDEATAEVVQMVLAGKTNKDLVAQIGTLGGRALGLCGIDGGMIQARVKDPALGLVGEIESIDPRPITDALESGYIPVVATVGTDKDGTTYNINADTVAAEIAVALKAENLITLTDIRGLMRDLNDPESLIRQLTVDEIEALIESGSVAGGMIPKVQSCERAVRGGVKKAVMIDGRIPHSILIEIFSDEGIGTLFTEGDTDEDL